MAVTTKQGNASGSISTIPFDIACKIISFFLTPRQPTGSVTLNLYVVTGTGNRAIIPIDTIKLSGTIYAPEVGQLPIVLSKDQYLMLVSNASVDYWFNIESV